MISLHCTQCKQLLEMDEAFAGGVCRCQYCGTIQTVPSRLKSQPKTKSSGSKSASSKALYKKSSTSGAGAPVQSGTGLDELAEIVASSGLARGSLSRPPRTTQNAAAPTPKRNPMLPWLIAAGAAVVVLLIVVAVLMTRGGGREKEEAGSSAAQNAPGSTATNSPPPVQHPPAPTGPSFAGVALPNNGSVAYLIDRSQANEEIIDAVESAVSRSVLSLGKGRQFQIIYWHRTDEGIIAYPDNAMAPATREQVQAAEKRFEDVVAYRSTELKPTIEKAVKLSPDTIVIVTAKGNMLEDADAAAVLNAVKSKPIKVFTFALGEVEGPVLKQIANQTGGQYRAMQYRQFQLASQ
jgi:hypothetical protein